MTVQPFTLAWFHSKRDFTPVADEAGLSAVVPQGRDFVKQLRATLKSQTLYSRGAMLTSLSLLAACGGSGGGGTPTPTPTPPANNAPDAGANTTLTVNEDAADTSLGITAPTDADGDTLTITIDTVPTQGDLISGGNVVTTATTLSAADIGDLEYRPDANENGAAGVFEYTVSDPDGASDSQTVTIDVTPVNDGAPVLDANTTETVLEDGSIALGITAPTDPDPEQTLTITVDTVPTSGSVLNGATPLAPGDTLTAAQLSALTFEPTADFNGAAGTFEYTVTDGAGGSTSQTITLSVTAVNDAPVASNTPASVTVLEDAAASDLGITAPTDVDDVVGDLTITVTAIPTGGAVLSGGMAVAINDTLSATELAALQFEPTADFSGDAGTFSYSVVDPDMTSDTQSIGITVTAVEDVPVVDGNASGSATAGVTLELGITEPTDADGDTLTITVTSEPTIGEIQKANGDPVGLGDTLMADELPGLRFVTMGTDEGAAGSFAYSVDDGTSALQTSTITLSVASSTFSLASLDGTNGFSTGGVANASYGAAIAGGGDVNNDGNADILISAPNGNNIFVFFGGQNTNANVDPDDDLDPFGPVAAGYIISGGVTSSFGASIATGGDFNGDGVDDFVVGAPTQTVSGETDAGQSYVVFSEGGTFSPNNISGQNTPGGAFDMGGGNPPDGFTFISEEPTALGGFNVAFIGDVNGDGEVDLAFGLPGADVPVGGPTTDDQGQVSIVFGIEAGETIDPIITNTPGSMTATSSDAVFNGPSDGAQAGSIIAGLGDINGDGIDDFAITSAAADGGNGLVTIVYGNMTGVFESDLSAYAADASIGFQVVGAAGAGAADEVGKVAGGGDFNGDGINDIYISAPGADTSNGTDSGAVLVIYGRADSSFGFGSNLNFAGIDAADGLIIEGTEANAGFGDTIASIGDFNDDGFDDFAATSPSGDGGNGSVFVVFGQSDADLASGLDLTSPDVSVFVEASGGGNTSVGRSLAGLGDTNGDGFDDIGIGADGNAFIVYGFGSETGVTPSASAVLALDGGIALPDTAALASDDSPPMDTGALETAGAASPAGGETLAPAGGAGDILMPEDIDLSGIA